MQTSYPKLIVAAILTIYFLWIAYNPLAGRDASTPSFARLIARSAS